MKITNAALGDLLNALSDLGSNKLPFDIAESLAEKKEVVLKAIQARDRLKVDLVKPYIPKGKSEVSPEDEGYNELVDKMLSLYNKEIDIKLGKPISRSALTKIRDLSCKESTIRVLRKHKVLIGKAGR